MPQHCWGTKDVHHVPAHSKPINRVKTKSLLSKVHQLAHQLYATNKPEKPGNSHANRCKIWKPMVSFRFPSCILRTSTFAHLSFNVLAHFFQAFHQLGWELMAHPHSKMFWRPSDCALRSEEPTCKTFTGASKYRPLWKLAFLGYPFQRFFRVILVR